MDGADPEVRLGGADGNECGSNSISESRLQRSTATTLVPESALCKLVILLVFALS